ncbi:hypothetical protein RA19_00905 [Leisingera sp. ANG-M1]|uniref:hypothetical protein n=1 Tax=Leisingera sp. ANG-M1 TaxID=1577895 RepID=UPI0005800F95|nr:hypothetical protein [Leisingera sp. ANG-M1]KIC12989.1 hypothetical protein RA19_00905 [Leisingera sp. ANG-M1]
MNWLTPPQDAVTYKTIDGLEFWMDNEKPGAPLVAPTIRTSNPEVSIVFVPNTGDDDDAYLMQFNGTSMIFSNPAPALRRHCDVHDRLKEENPDVDFAIKWIGRDAKWFEHTGEQEGRALTIPSARKFRSWQEQQEMTRLFCELMALNAPGPYVMYKGGSPSKDGSTWKKIKKRVVGFDHKLRARLAAGEFVQRSVLKSIFSHFKIGPT